ncbi:hypothetical protein ALC53_05404 [Atta colombica]|uniref:Uncharacterized protein n=1 Tax=Atta colombica TaxID=520822 RepID=A0A195BIS5_9HYME|nr:hypothetical protein ALC53_05404 [Atta colombica]
MNDTGTGWWVRVHWPRGYWPSLYPHDLFPTPPKFRGLGRNFFYVSFTLHYVIPDVTLPDSRQSDKVPSPWLSTAHCRAVVSAFSPPRNDPCRAAPFIDRSNHGFMRLLKRCTSTTS